MKKKERTTEDAQTTSQANLKLRRFVVIYDLEISPNKELGFVVVFVVDNPNTQTEKGEPQNPSDFYLNLSLFVSIFILINLGLFYFWISYLGFGQNLC